MRQDELKTLRDNLKRARKLLASSPRDLRPEREAEVEGLHLLSNEGEFRQQR
jgi:ribosomal RNA-processing protein 36